MTRHLALLALLVLAGCGTRTTRDCALAPLDHDDVIAVADAFLDSQGVDPAFRAKSEHRVTPDGCDYIYEESEALDSFGIAYEVVVSRKRIVVSFNGLH